MPTEKSWKERWIDRIIWVSHTSFTFSPTSSKTIITKLLNCYLQNNVQVSLPFPFSILNAVAFVWAPSSCHAEFWSGLLTGGPVPLMSVWVTSPDSGDPPLTAPFRRLQVGHLDPFEAANYAMFCASQRIPRIKLIFADKAHWFLFSLSIYKVLQHIIKYLYHYYDNFGG